MGSTSKRDVAELPEGTRLLHIGPHKTGTTSLQGALWGAREAMLAQGVRHVGRTRNPSTAVRAVTGQQSPYDADPPPMRAWSSLAREIRGAHEPRVVVSSEFFAWATPDVVRRIADDLGPHPLHIAVTLRPLARIMPSMWQQNVQAGRTAPFDRWLEVLVNKPPHKTNPAFWMLHRHDQLIDRWASVLGPDRVTAIVVDDRDHELLLRDFERLLGLRAGTLALVGDLANRSLTMPEAEAVRAFNVAFEEERLPKALHARIMRFGAAQEMKRRRPASDEPRVALPAWAEAPVAEIAAEVVAGIAASGVRVVGDLGLLTPAPAEDRSAGATTSRDATPIVVAPEVAATMAMGVLVASGQARRHEPALRRLRFAEPIEMARVPTTQVVAAVVLRAWRGLAGLRRRRRGGATGE